MPSDAAVRLVREALADIGRLPRRDTASLRRVRRSLSRQLRNSDPTLVLSVADRLVDGGFRWIGYELINQHEATMGSLTLKRIESLGAGLSSWGEVDAFGTLIAGPAWLNGRISDAAVGRWARNRDPWWRRTALVATTVLNTKSRGGRGDTARTLAVAEQLISDREDMVVKALSWALRLLVSWDASAVSSFVEEHASELPARVRREVRNKLTTGFKDPGRRRS